MGLQKSHQGGMISLSGPWTRVSTFLLEHKRLKTIIKYNDLHLIRYIINYIKLLCTYQYVVNVDIISPLIIPYLSVLLVFQC